MINLNKNILFVLLFTFACCTVNVFGHGMSSKSVKTSHLMSLEEELDQVDADKVAEYEAAVNRILRATPTTLSGDLGRDLLISLVGFIPMFVVNLKTFQSFGKFKASDTQGTEFSFSLGLKTSAVILATLIARVLIDKKMRGKDEIDKNLDILISQKGQDLEALLEADFDVEDIEKKIVEHGNKCEWARWIHRSGYFVFTVLMACFTCLKITLEKTRESEGGDDVKPKIKHVGIEEPAWLSAASVVAIGAVFWYAVFMQSASFKTSSRMEKLAMLKQLINLARHKQAKKQAQKEAQKIEAVYALDR